jgi:serine/threonine-protein kinase
MTAMSERDLVERLVQLASTDGFGDEPSHELDEALRLLADVRRTPNEGRALELLLAIHASRPLPDALVASVAAALVDRGEDAAAGRALAGANSPSALMIRADLLARAGRLVDAADMAERVLLRDFDWPGARERHARWRGEADRFTGSSPETGHTPFREGAPSSRAVSDSPFRIVREIARGGAGTVYEAVDRDLGRRVALKVYHQPTRDREQLLHEARVAVALAGEGIVRVFDVDPDRGWIAMPWAPLGALASRLRDRDSGVLAAVDRWTRSLARSLARVHAAGWVHHDVKPANALLDAPDRVLLTDFATARRFGQPGPPGSQGYVSPERLAGRASDPRDDVYGFGRILDAAVDALESSGNRGGAASWRAIARTCTGPDAARPADGAALVALLGCGC